MKPTSSIESATEWKNAILRYGKLTQTNTQTKAPEEEDTHAKFERL